MIVTHGMYASALPMTTRPSLGAIQCDTSTSDYYLLWRIHVGLIIILFLSACY